jgi:organic radical activating enzyme
MSISINNLAIEVTRRCNIACDFCLRGESQNKNIDVKYIDILLDQVYRINHFCPTGGEPSLNVDAIKYFINACKIRNLTIEDFYIATNGININEAFIESCLELYELSRSKHLCGVQVSNDIYHINEKMYDDSLLKKLPFYSKRTYDGSNLGNGDRIHREGRFATNKNAKIKSAARPVTSVGVFDSNPIYLNVNGKIINGCDWSYYNQNKHILCDVKDVENFKNNLY